jgi:transcriptional regulator with XRE-family HTH domain
LTAAARNCRFRARRANPVFSDEYRVLRDVVREARFAARLSQRDLAAGLGKHPSHIAMIECGQRRIDALELYRMAKVLGVAPVHLFEAIATRLEEFEGAAP